MLYTIELKMKTKKEIYKANGKTFNSYEALGTYCKENDFTLLSISNTIIRGVRVKLAELGGTN